MLKLNPANALGYLDLYDTIKKHVLAASPEVATRLREIPNDAAWRSCSLEEFRLYALMSYLKWDTSLPNLRRKARKLMGRRETEINAARDKTVLREESPEVDLTPQQLRGVELLLTAVSAEFIEKQLKGVATPQRAIQLIQKEIRPLNGVGAYEWLAEVGFPVVVPDAARMRWQERLGFAQERKTNAEERAKASRELQELAQALNLPVSEFNLILGAFCGSQGQAYSAAAICLKKPKCPECPVKDRCPYFQHTKSTIVRQNRSLAVTTRKEERPRERLEEKGAGVLSDAELIAILLRTGTGQANAVELANNILKNAETLDRLAAMSLEEMGRYKGLGRVKAITLKAAFELARRIQGQQAGQIRPALRTSRAIYLYLKNRFVGMQKEEFIAIHLNAKLEATRDVSISVGLLNQSLVHPREAFIEAIRDSAFGIVFAHNHPSGDPTPSTADRQITQKLIQCGQILGIKIVDHVIIGNASYYSFNDEGHC
ncbi:MAG: DNA repair protein RadC [Sumerlaeia bacterium]